MRRGQIATRVRVRVGIKVMGRVRVLGIENELWTRKTRRRWTIHIAMSSQFYEIDSFLSANNQFVSACLIQTIGEIGFEENL